MLDWLFDRKTNKEIDISRIGMDIHSHLIPGVDDGVQTIEESVEMIRKMQELGFRHLYTTPHVMWDCYKNTPEIILSGLSTVRAACTDAGLTIEIDAAAEYFIDEHFVSLLDIPGSILTLPGNRVLVELPYSTPLMNTSETLFHIIEKGYTPVLAHPERYTYFYSDPTVYKKLCEQGCELQLNILSVSSYYGENIKKMAEWLLKNKLITFLGSDAHKLQHLELISRSKSHSLLADYSFQNEKLMN
jgi:protein-tyrosine phosphatase